MPAPYPGTTHGRWMAPDGIAPLVSVIVPTFNRARLLGEAIDSVWRQTHRPIELLIVDDGSTDDTRAAAEAWAARHRGDPRFQARVVSQANGGAPSARNHGLIESTGAFIQFLDSDDLLHQRKLELQVAAFERFPAAGYVWSPHRRGVRFSRADTEAPIAGREPRLVSRRGLRRLPTKAVTGLFRRRVCWAIGPWNESLVRHQDWEYMARTLHCIDTAAEQPGALYLIQLHEEGRITDLQESRRKAVVAKLRSAEAAEAYARHLRPSVRASATFRRRLASRFFSIVQQALAARAWREARAAAAGIVRQWLGPIGRGVESVTDRHDEPSQPR